MLIEVTELGYGGLEPSAADVTCMVQVLVTGYMFSRAW